MKPSVFIIAGLLFCCKGEERVAGGDVAALSEFPFSTALLTNSGTTPASSYVQACGGAILTTNAILSAASCFYTGETLHEVSRWRARVGSSYANRGGSIYIINRITPHPNFNPTTKDNDIAVLRTRFIITLTPGVVEVARLVGAAYTFPTRRAVTAIGYGLTSETGSSSEELRSTVIYVADQQTCANRYTEVNFTVTDNMACIGWIDVGVRGQCKGDTGSPVIDNGAVVGVFSWAEVCADDYFMGINTRVPRYINWIVNTALANNKEN